MLVHERLGALLDIFGGRRHRRKRSDTQLAIIVGSGPSATSLPQKLPRDAVLIAVNNAWRIDRNFDYLIYPDDFPADRMPPKEFKGQLISNSEYMPTIDTAGGIILCGATMAFAAGYWAIGEIKPRVLGYFASDMVYNAVAGNTHFYGKGTADPLRKDISLGSLEAKSARLFCVALLKGTLIVNHSLEAESRLVFPRLAIQNVGELFSFSGTDLGYCWHSLLRSARELLEQEAGAPFNALRHDYWMLENDEEVANFIRALDTKWLQLAPEIAKCWSRFSTGHASLSQ